MLENTYISISKKLVETLTTKQAWHYRIVPKNVDDSSISFYIDNINKGNSYEDELEIQFGKKISLDYLESNDIQVLLSEYYKKTYNSTKTIQFSGTNMDGFLEKLILEAKDLGSSDIHLEIYDQKARIRIRIDGLLVERYTFLKADYPALVNRIKIKSNLDIAEKRLPQDGRIEFRNGMVRFDIRVSILPTLHGEKIVLRLLNRDGTEVNIEDLGMEGDELNRYLEGIKKPNGILLVSGPTGSGKTTTLYATLKILNEERRNIMTVEDPIEYTLEGINQVQLKENIGLTFAKTLKSFLRQDPDVIMLGEIRDAETAQMAIRAALTGHLVLSTVHTNSAWGIVSRLIDMGVPSFLLANTMNTAVAQRLLRKLCKNCKVEKPLDKTQYGSRLKVLNDISKQMSPVGCDSCFHTGYKGRTAIYEIIPIDIDFHEKIKKEETSVVDLLKEKQINTLAEKAVKLFKNGITSLEEIYPILLEN